MRKTRAQLDAEKLAKLEQDQTRIDKGEASADEVEAGLELSEEAAQQAADREAMYQELEARVAEAEADKPAPTSPKSKESDDASELRAELAKLKRTLSHYEQELNPAQRHAQELERQVEDLRRQLEERPKEPEGPLDYGLTDDEKEFDTVVSVAKKISAVESDKRFKALMDRLDKIDGKVGKFETATENAEISSRISAHRNQLSKELGGDNPDILFAHPKLEAWCSKQAEEEVLALNNPIVYTPKFVASILTRFKSEVLKGQAPKEPSQGDRGVPSRVTPDVVERSDREDAPGVHFNPRTFQSDVQKLISSGDTKGAEKLIALAERSVSA